MGNTRVPRTGGGSSDLLVADRLCSETATYVNIPTSPTSKKQLHYMEVELQESSTNIRGDFDSDDNFPPSSDIESKTALDPSLDKRVGDSAPGLPTEDLQLYTTQLVKMANNLELDIIFLDLRPLGLILWVAHSRLVGLIVFLALQGLLATSIGHADRG
uniref:Uncharacterized protein n=1 Tax=Sphaerodactylus townsendi TaxID=933632 RepID=A0ACB8E625_9SAUR